MRTAEISVSHYMDLLRRHCKLQTLDVVRAATQLPLQRSLFTADQSPRSDKTLERSFFSLALRSAKHPCGPDGGLARFGGVMGIFGNT